MVLSLAKVNYIMMTSLDRSNPTLLHYTKRGQSAIHNYSFHSIWKFTSTWKGIGEKKQAISSIKL